MDNLDAIVGGDSPEPTEAIQQYEEKHPEPETEEKPEPEAKPEAKAELEPKEEAKPETVPLATYLDTKGELKESKAALKALEERLAKLETPPEPEEGEPEFTPTVNYEDDPAQYLKEELAHQKALRAWDKKQSQVTNEKVSEAEKRQEAQNNINRVVNLVSRQEQEFRAKSPDYDEAVDYFREQRRNQAKAYAEAQGMEYTANVAANVDQSIETELLKLSIAAMQKSRNAAETVYNLAKTLGYKKPDNPGDAKLDRIEKGQKATSIAAISEGTESAPEPDTGDFIIAAQREAGYRR